MSLVLVALAACNGIVGNVDILYVDGGVDDVPDGGGRADADGGGEGDGVAPPCVDTQNDPSNCGVCGRSCRGLACKAGACEPESLKVTTGPSDPSSLTVFGGSVFWTSVEPLDGGGSQSRLLNCPAKPPCTPNELIPGFPFPGANHLTHTSTHVYWTERNTAWRCAPGTECSTGSVGRFTPVNTYSLGGLYVDDVTTLVTITVTPNTADPTVFRGPAFQEANRVVLADFATAPTPTAITMAGDYAVWIAGGGTVLQSCRVGQSPTKGGCLDTVTTIAQGLGGVNRLIGASDGIWWNEGRSTGTIQHCTLPGCAPVKVAEVAGVVAGLARQGDKLYFASNGVWRSSLTGTDKLLLAASPNQPRALALDDDPSGLVYWIEPGGIFRTPK